jgi:hypothetical protein
MLVLLQRCIEGEIQVMIVETTFRYNQLKKGELPWRNKTCFDVKRHAVLATARLTFTLSHDASI